MLTDVSTTKKKLQQIGPVLEILLANMKRRFPDAKPYDDSQSWTFDPMILPDSKCWLATVAANTGGHTMSFKRLRGGDGIAIQIIDVSGPARLFLAGWNEKLGENEVVSMPLFYDEVSE